MTLTSLDSLQSPCVDEPSDAVLIGDSLRRPERFAAVFDRHYEAIHGYAVRRLGPGLADDIASETFLIAFGRRTHYDLGQPDATPWLYGIASNLLSRHRRTEVRRHRVLARAGVDATVEGYGDAVVRRVDAHAVRSRLAAALADLDRRDREVLLLVAWAELSLEETARALGIPAGTARSRQHRARTRTRRALTDDPKGIR